MALNDWNNDGKNDFMDDYIEQTYIFDDDRNSDIGRPPKNTSENSNHPRLSVFENIIAGGFIAFMIAGITDVPVLFLPIFIPMTAFFIWASNYNSR